VALFSDVHANLPALDAVLADVRAIGVDERYALGDLVGYAPWPDEVLERLQADGIQSLMGNYDEGTGFDLPECGCAYTNPIEEALGEESFAWTKAHTSDANKAWLRSLPREIRFEADGKRYDVERTARAILATDLPAEFADQVREARGYRPTEVRT
jgi:hypothetical protein